MQGLLDPHDASLDFVMKRDNVRPIAIYRIEEDFLLCYDGESSESGACTTRLTSRIRFLRQQERLANSSEMGNYLGRYPDCFW